MTHRESYLPPAQRRERAHATCGTAMLIAAIVAAYTGGAIAF